MFHSLKSILPKTIAKYKIAHQIGANLICKETNKIIKDIIGEKGAKTTEAVYIKNGTITIKTNSSQISAELKLYERAIIETLKEKFKNKNIKNLRFIIN